MGCHQIVAAGVAALCFAGTALAQESPRPDAATCAAAIRALLADVAARDLDTSAGPPRNAFLTLNTSAIAEAGVLDRLTEAGARPGPLHCMPVAVKDNFDTYDMPVTVGSLSLVGNQPPRDAEFVARLRRAGAIIVGKTNMDEFAMGIGGISGAGGRVGNAYDPNQSAGGSSSGSGVAVGMGWVPIALGSDNCGSLRIPAAYNGAVSLRPTYGRFSTEGLFPIGFVNGVPGAIARDTAMLSRAWTVLSETWKVDQAQAPDALRGKRIGILGRLGLDGLWSAGDEATRTTFDAGLDLMRTAGAELVKDVRIDDFDLRLGTEFIAGFAPKVDALLTRYPGPHRDWRDICRSGRIRPEWSASECMKVAASSPKREAAARDRVAANRSRVVALLDRLKLDAIVYPVDGRGGAQANVSPHITCYIAGGSGLPAVAFPAALDSRGLPIGLELLGRPDADESLVAMMGAFEALRGAFPAPPAAAARRDMAGFDLSDINNIHLEIGYRAFRSRKSRAQGDLAPDRFRALTDDVIRAWQR